MRLLCHLAGVTALSVAPTQRLYAAQPMLLQVPPRPFRCIGTMCTAATAPIESASPGEDDSPAIASGANVPWTKIREISGPALINTLIDPILSLIDTLFVGRLGSSLALGAVACSSELFTLCFAVSLALRESASSTLSRLAGTDSEDEARAFARKTLLLALIAGVLLGVLIGGPSSPFCLALMGAGPGSALHPDALSYARVRAFGLPFGMLCSAMEGIFRGRGDTRSPLRASAYAAIVNTVLDPLLIFKPPFGAGWGVGGAAAATVVAQGVAFVSLFRTLLPWLQLGPAGMGPSFRSTTTTQRADPAMAVIGSAAEARSPERSARSEARVEEIPAPAADADARAPMSAPDVVTSFRNRRPRLRLHRRDATKQSRPGRSVQGSKGQTNALRTISATLLRSSCVLGTWVFITSTISRRLGADAIAAHGVVLKLWLLFVLSAEAPAVAGQVLCGGRIARGEMLEARALLVRLLSASFLFGLLAMLGLTAVAGPAARLFLPGDGAVAGSAAQLFRIAARSIPLVVPTVMTEAALLGAGASYGYLAGTTMLNAIATVMVARLTLSSPERAWTIILFFFSLRLSSAMGRLFLSRGGGGFGRWRKSKRRPSMSD